MELRKDNKTDKATRRTKRQHRMRTHTRERGKFGNETDKTTRRIEKAT